MPHRARRGRLSGLNITAGIATEVALAGFITAVGLFISWLASR